MKASQSLYVFKLWLKMHPIEQLYMCMVGRFDPGHEMVDPLMRFKVQGLAGGSQADPQT